MYIGLGNKSSDLSSLSGYLGGSWLYPIEVGRFSAWPFLPFPRPCPWVWPPITFIWTRDAIPARIGRCVVGAERVFYGFATLLILLCEVHIRAFWRIAISWHRSVFALRRPFLDLDRRPDMYVCSFSAPRPPLSSFRNLSRLNPRAHHMEKRFDAAILKI